MVKLGQCKAKTFPFTDFGTHERSLGSPHYAGDVFSPLLLLFLWLLFSVRHGQNVLMTHFRYVGMSNAYTKGLATELNAESQTPARTEAWGKCKEAPFWFDPGFWSHVHAFLCIFDSTIQLYFCVEFHLFFQGFQYWPIICIGVLNLYSVAPAYPNK